MYPLGLPIPGSGIEFELVNQDDVDDGNANGMNNNANGMSDSKGAADSTKGVLYLKGPQIMSCYVGQSETIKAMNTKVFRASKNGEVATGGGA